MWDCNCLSLLDFNSLGTEIRSYYHGIFGAQCSTWHSTGTLKMFVKGGRKEEKKRG